MSRYDTTRANRGSLTNLDDRLSYSSMGWWATKIAIGIVIGGGIALVGVLLIVAYALAEQGVWLTRIGILLILAGLLVFLRYLGAPFTARWTVRIPDNWTFAVIDHQGYTLEYLPSGRLIVPWRWRTTIIPYVNFQQVDVSETIHDVLNSGTLPVDIEVSAGFAFLPWRADEDQFEALRQIARRQQLERMIGREIRDTVNRHIDTLAPVYGDDDLLSNAGPLEERLEQNLSDLEALGLFMDIDEPVTVRIRLPHAIQQTIHEVHNAQPGLHEQREVLQAVQQIAQELEVPYEEAFRLYYLLQRSGESVARTPGGEPIQPGDSDAVRTAGATTPSARDTVETEAVQLGLDVPVDDEDTAPRIVRDPQRAPDPIEVRRQRKRRSRRVE